MSVILLDFETTGLDTKTCRPIEIGAMLTTDQFVPVKKFQTLIHDADYPSLTPEVEKVTHITANMLLELAVKPTAALDMLADLVTEDLNYVIAYNKDFDEEVMRAEVARHAYGLNGRLNFLLTTPWLCAMRDVEVIQGFGSKKLAHVALDLGITVNPNELHRALGDVELMRQELIASGVTPAQMLAYQQEPWVYMQAGCEAPWKDGGASTAEAKANGYSFEVARGDYSGRKFAKLWVKRVKQKDVEKEVYPTLQTKVIGG